MRAFRCHQPTEVRFGARTVNEVGEIVGRYGTRCLMVTRPFAGVEASHFQRVESILQASGIEVERFAGVVENPTTETVAEGATFAKRCAAEVILGVGGGSSIDTAKAIAVEATHPGSCWDYLYFRDTQPTDATLPIVAIPTTSGTGAHVTQVAVVTETRTKTKSAIFSAAVYPKASIVDPCLVLTAPPHLTASTGFDAFCHAFESYIHVHSNPYVELLALESMRLIAANLPCAVENGSCLESRELLALADTLAGTCIANAGVTLPHGIAMAVSGQCPAVMHGEALAAVYPEFMRFTWASSLQKFAAIGRILDAELGSVSDAQAAERSCDALDDFLREIGMWLTLEQLGVSENDRDSIADRSMVLPDYRNNPRIATRDEIHSLLESSIARA